MAELGTFTVSVKQVKNLKDKQPIPIILDS